MKQYANVGINNLYIRGPCAEKIRCNSVPSLRQHDLVNSYSGSTVTVTPASLTQCSGVLIFNQLYYPLPLFSLTCGSQAYPQPSTDKQSVQSHLRIKP